MGELLVIAFLGGLITGLSPCIVPVLPVVVAGGSAGTSRARPYLIIAGLVVSFSLAVLRRQHRAQRPRPAPELPHVARASGCCSCLAVGLMIPKIGEWIERPFNRLGSTRYADSGGGFVLGLSLGLVFVPCAGPVLAAISAAAANHRVDASSFFVTIFYAAGATLPLLVFAVLAQRAATGWKKVREHLPVIRRVAGAVLAVTTLAIAFGVLDPLQRAVPGYTVGAGEPHREQRRHRQSASSPERREGQHVGPEAGGRRPRSRQRARCPAWPRRPNFTGIVTWLNTPGDQPLSLAQLKGKVVLIDFWTYSCINCQRSLPHVESLVQRLQEGRPGRRRRPHPGVRLRARRLQRAQRGGQRWGSTTRSPWTTTTAPGTPTTTSTGRPST